jgi:hypothetical protein
MSTAYTVEIGLLGAEVDFTSRVLGMRVVHDAPIGEPGRSTCILTLKNYDGALTPNNGGTYESVDWFSQGVFITASVGSSSATVFHGIISDFNLRDDGISSIVDIIALDWWTIAGRALSSQEAPGTFSGSISTFVSWTFDAFSLGFLNFSGVDKPLLGKTSATVNQTASQINLNQQYTQYYVSPYIGSRTVVAADWLRTTLMPAGPSVGWATSITENGTAAKYDHVFMTGNFVRETRSDFTFAESPSAGELPYVGLEQGFNSDEVINSSQLTTFESSPAVYTDSDSASLALYGARTISLAEVAVDSLDDYPNMSGAAQASRNAKMRADVSFTVKRIVTNSQMVDSISDSSTDAKFAQLLDHKDALWQLSTVEHTPTGGSTALTDAVVTWRRTIEATPAATRVTVEFYPAQYVHAFVLDSSTLGVLDTNRLG